MGMFFGEYWSRLRWEYETYVNYSKKVIVYNCYSTLRNMIFVFIWEIPFFKVFPLFWTYELSLCRQWFLLAPLDRIIIEDQCLCLTGLCLCRWHSVTGVLWMVVDKGEVHCNRMFYSIIISWCNIAGVQWIECQIPGTENLPTLQSMLIFSLLAFCIPANTNTSLERASAFKLFNDMC